MGDILFNTAIYLMMIALGFLLKKTKAVPENAADTAAAIVINVTLPAMLLYTSNGIAMNGQLMVYMLLGFGVNAVGIAAGLLCSRSRAPLNRAVMLLSEAGTDVGNFVLPFIATFFPGEGPIVLSAYNIGNTIMVQGGNYVAACRVSATGTRFGPKDMLNRLLSSVTFDTYLLILFLACTHLALPDRVMEILAVPAKANVFLVMLMIGLKLEFSLSPGEGRDIGQVLLVRLLCGVVLTALLWLTPLPRIAKIAISACLFGPPASVANVYSRKLGYTKSMTAQVNVICVFTGMAVITAMMMFFAG